MNDHEPELLPSGHHLQEFLAALLGRKVEVEALPLAEIPELYELRGYFVDDAGALAGVATVELRLAACLSAALSLTPIRLVQDALKEGQLGPLLKENLEEVMNVFSGLYNGEGLPHVRFEMIRAEGEDDPRQEELDQIVDRPPLFREFDLKIDEYGEGAMVLYRPWSVVP